MKIYCPNASDTAGNLRNLNNCVSEDEFEQLEVAPRIEGLVALKSNGLCYNHFHQLEVCAEVETQLFFESDEFGGLRRQLPRTEVVRAFQAMLFIGFFFVIVSVIYKFNLVPECIRNAWYSCCHRNGGLSKEEIAAITQKNPRHGKNRSQQIKPTNDLAEVETEHGSQNKDI